MQELARLSCEEYHKVEKLHIVVVLDDVRSLNNIGSIFRTADAFLRNHCHSSKSGYSQNGARCGGLCGMGIC